MDSSLLTTTTTTPNPTTTVTISQILSMIPSTTTQTTMVSSLTTASENLTSTSTSQIPLTTIINLTMTTTNQILPITTVMTTRQLVLNNYYIQFSFPLNVSDQNITDTQLISELISIFITALNITSNQLNIIITTGVSRAAKRVVAQVRFFSTASESADDLLTQTQKQFGDSSSKIQQQTSTSKLNIDPIENIQRYDTCSNGLTQQSPYTTNGTSKSESPSLSVILIVSIIPPVIGFISLIILGFFIVKYIRGTPFKSRTSRFDHFQIKLFTLTSIFFFSFLIYLIIDRV